MKHTFITGQLLHTNQGLPTNLTYIDEAGYIKKSMRQVLVKCKCGVQVVKLLASIRAGSTNSCGMLSCRTKTSPLLKKKFVKGQKVTDFFYYVDEDLLRSTSNHRYIKVECGCGNTSSIRIDAIAKNVSCKKCGVVKRRETFHGKHQNALYNSVFSSYKRQALKRNYFFDITFEQFKILAQSNCYYCGNSPSNTFKSNGRELRYNGVDRIDNQHGYTGLNTVACCGSCNMMKNALGFETFLAKIKKIHQHLNL